MGHTRRDLRILIESRLNYDEFSQFVFDHYPHLINAFSDNRAYNEKIRELIDHEARRERLELLEQLLNEFIRERGLEPTRPVARTAYISRNMMFIIIVAGMLFIFALLSGNLSSFTQAPEPSASSAATNTPAAAVAESAPSATAVIVPTETATQTATATPSSTPTNTSTPTQTPTLTPTPTATSFSLPVIRSTEVAAAFFRTPPLIDGQIDDWVNVLDVQFYEISEVAWTNPDLDVEWEGVDDLQGFIALGWDEQFLYIAAQVNDDMHKQDTVDAQLYKGDGVEFLLDTSPLNIEPTVAENQGYQVVLSPGNFDSIAPFAYVYDLSGPLNEGFFDVQAAPLIGQEAGYYIEAAIPSTIFNLDTFNCLDEYRATLSVNENDNASEDVQEFVLSNVSGRALINPSTWGYLRLSPPRGVPCVVQTPTTLEPANDGSLNNFAVSNCAFSLWWFWQAKVTYESERLGCPTSNIVDNTDASSQKFNGGVALWREDRDQIYMISDRDRFYSVHTEHRAAGQDYFIRDTVKNGIGYLWYTNQGLQQRMGDPSEIESVVENLRVQDFQGGTLLFFDNKIYVLYNDNGSWFSVPAEED